ncbi:hypothetical protein DUNSADRAFT_10468 [Dunaliella salina]|uniref:uroporphyrinogen-III C-methyltransferase n=1 Tax=Dunaliella salina TaxID=3046 RepID=A0ABQ7GF80_DUNSA|nr:hypothetical protein DUNSADRAFT_10468 [Dunaliella salina]|eukprot:KAF5833268.1 hypothetical protein DUNSADRAFT_10468 [Dunaliella salina]
MLHQFSLGCHAAHSMSSARHALPVRTAPKSAPSAIRSRSVLPRSAARNVRCFVVLASCNHPDFPKSESLSKWGHELREEDILELESFLRSFQQRRDAQVRQQGSALREEDAPGEVFLVGTGPGDPGLLTLRAVQLMQTADVVLYDRLVSDDILRLVGPHARMVYVGKHSGFHTRSQEEIHQLLLAFAEAGARVIRLKGGDPYVFGRGGEEVAYLASQGIHVQCVPGITAASGICAELGIPMTHRGVATSVRFLTGHARDGGEQELLDSTVAGAADPHTTLVVYMGLQTLPNLYAQLQQHGMPPNVPAVAVERGTTRRQRTVWGEVGQLPRRTQEAGLKSPALIVIGQVVSLAPGWQQWRAAGQPLLWREGHIPSHGYALPDIDGAQLHSHAVASQLTSVEASADASVDVPQLASVDAAQLHGHAVASQLASVDAPQLASVDAAQLHGRAMAPQLAAVGQRTPYPSPSDTTTTTTTSAAPFTNANGSSADTVAAPLHSSSSSSSSSSAVSVAAGSPAGGAAEQIVLGWGPEGVQSTDLQQHVSSNMGSDSGVSKTRVLYAADFEPGGGDWHVGRDLPGVFSRTPTAEQQQQQQQPPLYQHAHASPSCDEEANACELPFLAPQAAPEQQQQQHPPSVPSCDEEANACELPFLAPQATPEQQQQQLQQHAPFVPSCDEEANACELPFLAPQATSEQHQQQQQHAPSVPSCDEEANACELPFLAPQATPEQQQQQQHATFVPSCDEEANACELPFLTPQATPEQQQQHAPSVPSCDEEANACELPFLTPQATSQQQHQQHAPAVPSCDEEANACELPFLALPPSSEKLGEQEQQQQQQQQHAPFVPSCDEEANACELPLWAPSLSPDKQ